MPRGPAERSKRRFDESSKALDGRIDRAVGDLLRGRRSWRRVAVTLVILLAASFLLTRLNPTDPGHGGGAGGGADWSELDRKSLAVDRVVDGDTLRVIAPGGESVTVRLLGIDAPEMRNADSGRRDHFADRATNYLESRAQGRRVVLRLPEGRSRDRYGRVLAYVYADDSENLNQSLVAGGFAYAHRVYGHDLKSQFEQSENDARRKRRGLWAEVRDAEQPAWRRKWLRDKGYDAR